MAATANPSAYAFWFETIIPRVINWVLNHAPPSIAPSLLDALYRADRFVYAAMLGLAKGAVLARVVKRSSAIAVWVAANLLAMVVASAIDGIVLNGVVAAGMQSLVLFGLLDVAFWGMYAALTGVFLVAVLRLWEPVVEPSPA